MRKVILFFLITFTMLSESFGQLKDITLSQLKVPSAPAFSILGISPNEIARPKDLNSLELSLLNAVSKDNAFALPNSYALEVTPFWLTQPNITFEELEQQKGLEFIRTSSFSVATAQRNNLLDTTLKVNQLGLGFRTYLLNGRLGDLTKIKKPLAKIKILEQAIPDFTILIMQAQSYIDTDITDDISNDNYKILLLDLLKFPFNKLKTSKNEANKKIVESIEANFSKNEQKREQIDNIYSEVVEDFIQKSTITSKKNAKETLEKLKDAVTGFYNASDDLKKAVDEVRDFREKRYGLMIEVGGALNLATIKNATNLTTSKSAIWMTVTVRPEEKMKGFEFIGLWRSSWDKNELLKADNLKMRLNDVGIKIVFDQGRFFINSEVLYRYSISLKHDDDDKKSGNYKEDSGWRWGANFGYRVTPNILVAMSFGKSFDSDTINKGGYLSVLDVNFGFGKPVLKLK